MLGEGVGGDLGLISNKEPAAATTTTVFFLKLFALLQVIS